jgi:hypothetical protein
MGAEPPGVHDVFGVNPSGSDFAVPLRVPFRGYRRVHHGKGRLENKNGQLGGSS